MTPVALRLEESPPGTSDALRLLMRSIVPLGILVFLTTGCVGSFGEPMQPVVPESAESAPAVQDPLADGIAAAGIDANTANGASLRLLRGALSRFEHADALFRDYLAGALRRGSFDCEEAVRRARALAAELSAARADWSAGARELHDKLTPEQLAKLEASVDQRLASDPIAGRRPLMSWVRDVRGLSSEGADRLAHSVVSTPDPAGVSLFAAEIGPSVRDRCIGDAASARAASLVVLVEVAVARLSPTDQDALAAAMLAR